MRVQLYARLDSYLKTSVSIRSASILVLFWPFGGETISANYDCAHWDMGMLIFERAKNCSKMSRLQLANAGALWNIFIYQNISLRTPSKKSGSDK